MAQTSNTHTNTSQFVQQYQNLTQQASQQQAQFSTNLQSTQILQNNLLNTTHTNGVTADESKTQTEDELKQMSLQLQGIAIKQSGIEDNTQGTLTVHHNNRQLKPSYLQSEQYKDFQSMSDILRPELLDGCVKMNFINPSKIQSEAIPRCLHSKGNESFPNLIGQAHHGSGKTATFALVMLQRTDETSHKLQGLVVVHSRELAIQTYNVFISLGQFIQGLKVILALKGEDIGAEMQSWQSQICVGTPGTIIHKIFNAQKRSKNGIKGFLSQFKILVVDEADEFLKSKKPNRRNGKGKNNSFGSLFEQLKMITDGIQNNQTNKFQTLLFSATYPVSVKGLASEIAPNAFVIKVAQKSVALDNIQIFKIICNDEIDKFNTLLRVIALSNIGQMIVFVNTVNKAKQLIDGLESNDLGIACSALYGKGMDIKLRDLTMEQFRKAQTQCLVASNVIARGIDVPAVGLVVNFEVPISFKNNQKSFDSETFMHRVGRTGRFGAKGVCINLVAKDDTIGNDRLDAIQREYSLNISVINNSSKAIKQTISEWLAQQ